MRAALPVRAFSELWPAARGAQSAITTSMAPSSPTALVTRARLHPTMYIDMEADSRLTSAQGAQ